MFLDTYIFLDLKLQNSEKYESKCDCYFSNYGKILVFLKSVEWNEDVNQETHGLEYCEHDPQYEWFYLRSKQDEYRYERPDAKEMGEVKHRVAFSIEIEAFEKSLQFWGFEVWVFILSSQGYYGEYDAC